MTMIIGVIDGQGPTKAKYVSEFQRVAVAALSLPFTRHRVHCEDRLAFLLKGAFISCQFAYRSFTYIKKQLSEMRAWIVV